ncbi:MAG TPA: response regulator [Polyangiaceae bacterium]|nr:response regulator [Polyangiaceae bacterium]
MSGTGTRGPKVLLIDDEALVRSTLKRVLDRVSSEVLTAASGEEGLSVLRANPDVRVVLLDLSMPDLNGTEVLKRLRDFNVEVPVYLMTGFLPDGIDVSTATGVLAKPIDIDRVRRVVASYGTNS